MVHPILDHVKGVKHNKYAPVNMDTQGGNSKIGPLVQGTSTSYTEQTIFGH